MHYPAASTLNLTTCIALLQFKRKRRVVSLRKLARVRSLPLARSFCTPHKVFIFQTEAAEDYAEDAGNINKSGKRRAVLVSDGEEESDDEDVTISAGAGTPGKKKRPRRN